MQTNVALRLISPFRCQFNLDNTLMSIASDQFDSFLHCIEDGLADENSLLRRELAEGVEVHVKEHQMQETGPRYVSLNEAGNLFHSPAYLDLGFGAPKEEECATLFQEAAKAADKLVEARFPSLSVSIFDHTIGVLTLDIELDPKEVEEHPEEWKGLDGWTTFFIEHIIDYLYPRYVHPTLDNISAYVAPHFKDIIVPPSEHVIYHDMKGDNLHESVDGKLLWVNRTLMCPPGTKLKGWVNFKQEEKEAIVIDEALVYLYSSNNIVEMPKGLEGHDLRRLWEGLYIGQYYYAAMDVTSKNISRYVGLSYITKSNNDIRKLSYDMEFLINAITIFQMRYKDLYIELQGIPLLVFQRIEKEWEFAKIFDNVKNKLTLCKSNLSRLNQVINQRNQLRVQLVLAVVAGMGLVNLMVQVSRFSKQLGDEAITGDQWRGIMDLGVLLTPNAMGWLGFFMAAIVVLTILYNRPR
ncbi:MAG: hypothetical protein ACPG80_00880 [Rickettsiales bacterium]